MLRCNGLQGYAQLLVVAVLGLAVSTQAVDIKVAAADGASGIQNAINQCPDNDATGCRIILTSAIYVLDNSLLIRNKNNLTITSSTTSRRPEIRFQDKGNLAGPDDKADSLAFKVAGWKHWPIGDGSDVGQSKNTTNPFSTSGSQRNGTILIQGSHNITLDGIMVNGITPVGWGSSVWSSTDFYGNVGVNLYLSGNVTITNCEIKGCFAAIYIMNRNLGGVLAHKNAGDMDAASLAPGSKYGQMGNHLFEKNLIHDDIWAVFQESNYDLGSTFRFNRFYNLHNNSDTLANWTAGKTTFYDVSYTTPTIKANSEASLQCGGFMQMKDDISVPDKIYHNTFWQVTTIYHYDGWRGGTQHYFYNNLVLTPWLDYNADTTSYRSGNFGSSQAGVGSYNNLTKSMGTFAYANTFAYFPLIPLLAQSSNATTAICKGNTDSCQNIKDSLRSLVWPKSRLTIQTQKVANGPNVVVNGTTYYNTSPLKDLYYITGLQYQPNNRQFIFQNDWGLSSPSISDLSANTSYSSTVEAASNGKDIGATATYTYKGYDSSVIRARFGAHGALMDSLGLASLPWWTDTIGTIRKMGGSDSVGSHGNCYIRSVPVNTSTTASAFLTPDWTDAGVITCILNKVWNPATGVVSTSTDQVAQGAMQPDGTNSVDMLELSDNSPALIVDKLATVSFDLSSTVSGVTNLKVVYAQFIKSVSDADGATYSASSSTAIPLGNISGTVSLGGNTLSIQLPDTAGYYSRIELMISGTTADGRTIYSNIGVWIVRKSQYSFAVSFHPTYGNTKDTTDTVRAGDLVWMRVQPLIRTAVTSSQTCNDSKGVADSTCYTTTVTTTPVTAAQTTVTTFSIRATKMYDGYNGADTLIPSSGVLGTGKFIPASGRQDSSSANVWWTQVYFTKAGLAAPVMTGLADNDTSKVFTGGGSIYVRPNVPYVAVLAAPGSYSVTDTTGTLIPYNTKTKVTLNVEDKYGNLVDTASTVTLSVLPNGSYGLKSVVGDNLTNRVAAVNVPATGIGTSYILSKDNADSTSHFTLESSVAGSSTLDSAWVKVGKVPLMLSWVKTGTTTSLDSIDTLVKSYTPITLRVTDGDGNALSDTEKVLLSSKSGKLQFSLVTDASHTVLDTVISTNGTVNLFVFANTVDSLDSIIAVPLDGDAEAVIAPVTFYAPPVPPYPLVDSALLKDADCSGTGDYLEIDLKASSSSNSASLDTTAERIHKIKVIVGSDTTLYDSTSWSFAGTSKSVLKLPVDSTLASHITLNGGKFVMQYTLHQTYGTGVVDTVVWAGDSAGVTISDRVAPQVISATVIENYTSLLDTFIVRFTKSVSSSAEAWAFLTKGDTVKNTSGLKVESFALESNAETPFTYVIVVSGNRNSADLLTPTMIAYSDSIKIDPSSALVDASGNHGADCALYVPLTKLSRLPAVASGFITATDGTGEANSITITFARSLDTATESIDSVSVEFGGVIHSMKVSPTGSGATWSMTLSNPFAYGLTRGTSADNYGAKVSVYGLKNGSRASSQGALADSVPVVFGPVDVVTPYAQLKFGQVNTAYDTLLLTLSEPVHTVSQVEAILRHDSTIASTGISLASSDSLMWNVVVKAGDVNSGDTIELGSSFVGNDGVKPAIGANASKAVVVGGDRAPVGAYYSDPTGIGTASQLTLLFSRALKHGATFRVLWPDGTGNLMTDTIYVPDSLAVGKDSLVLTGLEKTFKIGITGSDAALSGTMQTVFTDSAFVQFNNAVAKVRFAIADSVPPVVNAAHMSYGSYSTAETSQDTLKVSFSEPVHFSDINKILRIKRIGTGALETVNGLSLTSVLLPGDTSAYIYFDTSASMVVPHAGDSVRLIEGAIADTHGNVVGALSRYVLVTAGARPAINPTLNIILPNEPSTQYLLTPTPAATTSPLAWSGSNVVIITRRSGDVSSVVTPLSTSNSGVSWANLTGTIGVELPSINEGTIMEHSVLAGYIYDKYGIYVGRATADLDSSDFKSVEDATGKFNIQILWDGRAVNGSVVASGIYTIRVLLIQDVKQSDGSILNKVKWNYLRNIGIKR